MNDKTTFSRLFKTGQINIGKMNKLQLWCIVSNAHCSKIHDNHFNKANI